MLPNELTLNRNELSKFLPDAASIRQFENLFKTTVDTADQTQLNTGDITVLTARTISTTAPLAGGGDLSADRTISIPAATAIEDGFLSASDQDIGGVKKFSENIVLPKTAGKGIEVDPAAPTFPWRDMIGLLVPDLAGANSPILTAFIGGSVRGYAYTLSDKMDLRFHIPHDYLTGSDLFIHMHWSHNGTAINGDMVGTFASTYAKGHNQAIFTAEKTVTITYSTVDIATTPQYIHRIDEVQLSSIGGSATLLDTSLIEPDGLIEMNFTLTTLPTVTGGSTARLFIPFIDIHYQSTGVGTKQKAPDFYV